jgi:hypothetical protein
MYNLSYKNCCNLAAEYVVWFKTKINGQYVIPIIAIQQEVSCANYVNAVFSL